MRTMRESDTYIFWQNQTQTIIQWKVIDTEFYISKDMSQGQDVAKAGGTHQP